MLRRAVPVLIAIAVCVMVGTANAESYAKETEESHLESWYLNVGLGAAFTGYPSEIQELLDAIEDMDGVDRIRIGLDMGVYFPIGTKAILGAAITGAGDRLEADSDNWMQVNQYLYAVSAQYFLGREIGQGLFLRGDMGLAAWVVENEYMTITSERGFGGLIGAGYSWPIFGGGTRIMLEAAYSPKRISGETLSAATVNFRFMF